jgi:ATP-binding cassette subfamily B protein
MIFFAPTRPNGLWSACLAMVSSHYGKDFGLQYLRDKSFITREGVSLLGISEAADKIGFKTIAAKLKPENFKKIFALHSALEPKSFCSALQNQ